MKLEGIIGLMFSGKSTELLRRLRTEEEVEKNIAYFKSALDVRYAADCISTHYGLNKPAIPITSTDELYKHFIRLKPQVIGIDEVQFLDDKIIDFCLENAKDTRIIFSGLNTNFRAEPFKFKDSPKHIGDLIVHSLVTSLTARCKYRIDGKDRCGQSAYFTQRLINGEPAPYQDAEVLVGSSEAYEARCENHHTVPGKKSLETYSARNGAISAHSH